MQKNKSNMDEQMKKVSGGQITSNVNVTLTGDDALAYLNSDLYKNSKNNSNNNTTKSTGVWGSATTNIGWGSSSK